jgi:hypothetical protein
VKPTLSRGSDAAGFRRLQPVADFLVCSVPAIVDALICYASSLVEALCLFLLQVQSTTAMRSISISLLFAMFALIALSIRRGPQSRVYHSIKFPVPLSPFSSLQGDVRYLTVGSPRSCNCSRYTIMSLRQRRKADTGDSQPSPKDEPEPSNTTKAVRKLLHWDDLPYWQRDNQHIHTGYRPASSSFLASFHSWTYLHNETVNIYTKIIKLLF